MTFTSPTSTLIINLSQNQGITDETANAQIDTLILDNRKKLKEIIGKYPFEIYVEKHSTLIGLLLRLDFASLRAKGG
jgi:hypothetical protein